MSAFVSHLARSTSIASNPIRGSLDFEIAKQRVGPEEVDRFVYDVKYRRIHCEKEMASNGG